MRERDRYPCKFYGSRNVKLYPADKIYEEVSFIGYYFYWDHDSVMEMPHAEKIRWGREISRINADFNGNPKIADFLNPATGNYMNKGWAMEVDLDTEIYEEILERARRMTSGIYPQWTDYNEHDSGMTFLQLFFWMKEMQQFYLNQIGNGHKEMYLKLLGMKRKRRKAPMPWMRSAGQRRICFHS